MELVVDDGNAERGPIATTVNRDRISLGRLYRNTNIDTAQYWATMASSRNNVPIRCEPTLVADGSYQATRSHIQRGYFGSESKLNATLAGEFGEQHAKAVCVTYLIHLVVQRSGQLTCDRRQRWLKFGRLYR
jgi:hypothetical protein